MIKNVEPISSTDFNKGLVTRADFLKGDINASPDTMDVQWGFDASLQKRLGHSSTNSVAFLGSSKAAGFIQIDTATNTLTNNLISYWKLDESSGTRYDAIANNDLIEQPNVLSVTGLRGLATDIFASGGSGLYVDTANNTLGLDSSSSFSISCYVYLDTTNVTTVLYRALSNTSQQSRIISALSGGINKLALQVDDSVGSSVLVWSNSFGAINTSTWYSVVGWHSNNSHIGISVDLSVTTASFTTGLRSNFGKAGFEIGKSVLPPNLDSGWWHGRIDEVGFWNRVLTVAERTSLYAGGSGNTYSGPIGPFSWASFDFGASNIRWLTVAAGTGILASSNRGTTFITIGTTRTQTYQSFSRSKNVLIATSDAYDPTLYWAGSTSTFAAALSPNSAPMAKFSVNYQGFLILLNFMNSNNVIRNRGFAYADENLQLTDTWQNSFDIPSSADDEITASFILYKFLYVSTRYTIYRVAFTGGNPDWTYLKVKDWGFVPRTVSIVSLKGGGQVAMGMDWDRRIRIFDGFEDLFASDNIENNNGMCDFSMDKISYMGSGLIVSNGVLDPTTQEYKLNVSLGPESTQTTTTIVMNCRSLAWYPYSNQQFQTMCVASSNNQNALMAFDRSGFCWIMNSGNLDYGTVPIDEHYDSPPLFSKLPQTVSKGRELDVYFTPLSCGTIYIQDRTDLSNQYSPMAPLGNRKGDTAITGTENVIKILRTVNVPSTYNTWQFRITSSANTADPWQLDRLDYLQKGFGIGQGQ